MKLIKIDIEEFSNSRYFQNIIDEKDKKLLHFILDCTNSYLENEQKNSDVQIKRRKHAEYLAYSKRYDTAKLIAEYAKRADLFSDDIDKYKIANIARHIGRTDKTVRNVLTDYANAGEIKITGKLQDYAQMLCEYLAKGYKQ